ncbi:DUF1566 domain-containing protein [Bordetella genomosp. 4]|uniref:DUF1566 domain-containing protein n=1 Tax=Bordetella genomosp. 4 TaxID=463044 RepID=A0A261U801_9BORD|nr:DUF1566 domain-containing protein [Bordetella genomosp. 4]OZI57637.1 hypothetical protein CAL20_09685 [Bordetella genomosp. 4]
MKDLIIGQYVEGQGGIYIGQNAAGKHLVIAANAVDGEFEFGGYGEDLEGYSDSDGAENTRKLLERGDHPAAQAAADYTADGHSDFFLPSQRELMLAFAALGVDEELSDVWTSTPYGSLYAWAVSFEYGRVDLWDRTNEFRVRPVRIIN